MIMIHYLFEIQSQGPETEVSSYQQPVAPKPYQQFIEMSNLQTFRNPQLINNNNANLMLDQL